MKTLLIYNPLAGNTKRFLRKLDYIIDAFQRAGKPVLPYRLNDLTALPDLFFHLPSGSDYQLLIAGGDGAIHQCLNAMLKSGCNFPVGIYPTGTANDFFQNLGLPVDIEKLTEIYTQGICKPCDLAMANGQYFINVASLGFLIDVSQRTDPVLKSNLGVFAYYIRALEEFPSLRPAKIKITSGERTREAETIFTLVLNGRSAGGFKKVAPMAAISDGLLDIFIFKPCPLTEALPLLLQVVNGDHLQSPYVDFFQTSNLELSCQEEIGTDLDGENGVSFPIKIRVLPQALKILAR